MGQLVFGITLALLFTLGAHNVPVEPTNDDFEIISTLLAEAGVSIPSPASNPYDLSLNAQLELIESVQLLVLHLAPRHLGIPYGELREPADLARRRHGECYDRSRAIEKILRVIGFDVRHVSIYSTSQRSAIKALLTKQNPSHSATEVRAGEDWLLVDSNGPFLGVGVSGELFNASDIPPKRESINKLYRDHMPELLANSYIYIRGLYSRHGKFYPPFTVIPDYNIAEMLDGFAP